MSIVTKTIIALLLTGIITYYQTIRRRMKRATKFTISDEIGKDITNMVNNITVGRQRVVSIDPSTILDAKGNKSKIDGIFVYKIDSTKFKLFPAADGLSCGVLATAPTDPGELATLEVDADVDQGPGIKILAESTQFTASSSEATTFTLSVGTETDPV